MKSRLILVDLSSFIYRAFYAIRMLSAPDGTPVNAVHGVLSMFLKLISDYQPTHMLIAKDSKGLLKRKEIFPEYKANRQETPADLIVQFDIINKLVDKMGLVSVSKEKYEADDVIGTAATIWKNNFDEILIASSDKDLMQFVSDNVKMVDTMKDKIYKREDVFEKMGVWPEQMVDYLAIIGDSSDNVPGMKGIGPKGASKLLNDYKTLEGCIAVKDTYTDKRIKNAFDNHLQDAIISKQLVEIVTDLKLDVDFKDLNVLFNPTEDLINFLKELGFKSVLKKLSDMKYGEYQAQKNDDSFKPRITERPKTAFKHTHLNSMKELEQVLNKPTISMIAKYSNNDPQFEMMEAISISTDGRESYYYHIADLDKEIKKSIISFIVQRSNLEIIGYDTKTHMVVLLREDLIFNAKFYDVLQAYYNLDTGGAKNIEYVIKMFLGTDIIDEASIVDFSNTREFEVIFLGERACSLFLLKNILEEKLKEQNLEKINHDIDQPLIPVLAKMEKEGVLLNKAFFAKLENDFSIEAQKVEEDINKITDFPINLKSPKQVAELLFEKLNLPVIKKTKTGLSTDIDVLQELHSMKISEVPGLLIKYRELEKLLSTYVKVLPEMVNPKTGRLHTHFYQNNVSTGRLSSDRPNLQNIPVRSKNGKLIRKGFIARPGWLLLSADYSQIELRLLAHFSKDKVMVEAFLNDLDIHSQTASEVSGISLDKVTSEERSKAKTVNFGLMYGQSSFGLAQTLGISRNEAKDYITKYFEKFSRVKSFLDELKEIATQKGFSETLYGRKRFIPELNNQNRMIKSAGERLAVNSPIQGTAADILKVAMINLDKKLSDQNLQTKMLLQVHDELIFEVPEDELELMKRILKEEMEGVVKLDVPLKVDMGIGVNWFDIK
ncbi:MAG: DNA polymerase I [Bdellovibrionales bacterium RIFOXYA1_FULL_36_14]|nr:MAG: DNA polymerase I [Bdellovibrionales bacterium RIFOXYA1_FULL_36_14]